MLLKTDRSGWLFISALLLLSSCGYNYESIDLEGDEYPNLVNTPFFSQQAYQCGPASLASLLTYSGVDVTPDDLVPLVYVPKRQGSFQVELAATARTYGRVPYIIDPSIKALAAELIAGRPVLVLQNYGLNVLPFYHFAVVIGLLPDDRIVLRSGTTKRHIMKTSQFLMSWLRPGAWAMVVLRPGELPDKVELNRYLQAVSDFEMINTPQEALPAYLAAFPLWPKNPMLLFALGNNYLKRGDLDEAISYYWQTLEVDKNHLGAINNLADALAKKGCFKEAKELIERGASLADQQSSIFIDVINSTSREIEILSENSTTTTHGPNCR